MDRQIEKLKLIEWLIGLKDIGVLKQLESIRSQNQQDVYDENLKPMSIEELKARAMESNKAIANGQVSDIQDILLTGGN